MSAIRKEVQIGDCRLLLGDATEIVPLLPAVDAVVTSPPYGQQRDYGKKINDWRALVSGAICPTPHHSTTQVLVNLGLVHREGEVIPYWQDFIADMREDGWRHFGWYVWDQMSGMMGDWNGRLAPSFEFVFHFNRAARKVNKTKPTTTIGKLHSGGTRNVDGSIKLKSHDGKPVQATKIPDSVIRTTRETSNGWESEHPARFPVRFADELIAPFTDVGDSVLDPFMGSGSTGVSCAIQGRKFIGIEIEERYFDLACRRITDAARQPDMFIEPRSPEPKQETLFAGVK